MSTITNGRLISLLAVIPIKVRVLLGDFDATVRYLERANAFIILDFYTIQHNWHKSVKYICWLVFHTPQLVLPIKATSGEVVSGISSNCWVDHSLVAEAELNTLRANFSDDKCLLFEIELLLTEVPSKVNLGIHRKDI